MIHFVPIPVRRPLGAAVPAQATCPACSYLWEGSCKVCADGDQHPGCEGCVGGKLPSPPWYKSELIVAVSSAVVVSLAVALIVPRIERAIAKGKP